MARGPRASGSFTLGDLPDADVAQLRLWLTVILSNAKQMSGLKDGSANDKRRDAIVDRATKAIALIDRSA